MYVERVAEFVPKPEYPARILGELDDDYEARRQGLIDDLNKLRFRFGV